LGEFAQMHPGGKQWIELTKGQDITEHFITHHLNEEKARKVLSRYFVRDVTPPRPLRFTFEEGGLYRVVKQRVLKQYKA
jgi:cytochrome b involved in lipid metabolism